MAIMSIDIETYSSVDLIKSGVYTYTEAEDFEILLFGYAFDDEDIQVIDLACDEKLPGDVLKALTDPNIIKTAFNANFERTCLAKHFNISMPAEQWHCTHVHALTLGLPGNLEDVAKSLKLKIQKDPAGKALVRFFTKPVTPENIDQISLTIKHRNMPEDNPEKWRQFKDYCRRDVEVEREIRKKLQQYPISEKEHKLWVLDQKINDTGVRVNTRLVQNAISCNNQYYSRLKKEASELTGLDNPNSVTQLKEWLSEREGIEVESLSKETVPVLIKQTECKTVARVLELRREMAKTSIKKYEAMERALCKDERIRGLFQFYGANRTGRWAGRLVQVQNLPQNKIPDLNLARQLLLSGDYKIIELVYDSVPAILSQLIRTAFIPAEGCRFIVSDFSAIEARVIAWLAGEKWRLDVFNSHGKIYEASAAQMFKVPLEQIHKGHPLRQKGKIAELALGYGGNKGALIQMGALKQGLKEEELPELVSSWRRSNLNIIRLWRDVEDAAITAVKEKKPVQLQYSLTFIYESGCLFIQLPSGRRLAYIRPRVETDPRFNKDMLTYEGYEQGKWGRLKTYGGKLVENIIQATARDCLAEAMLRLDAAGYKIVMHVHDEVVLEMPEGEGSLEEACEIMGQPLNWAPGLPLPADGFETNYYMKD